MLFPIYFIDIVRVEMIIDNEYREVGMGYFVNDLRSNFVFEREVVEADRPSLITIIIFHFVMFSWVCTWCQWISQTFRSLTINIRIYLWPYHWFFLLRSYIVTHALEDLKVHEEIRAFLEHTKEDFLIILFLPFFLYRLLSNMP